MVRSTIRLSEILATDAGSLDKHSRWVGRTMPMLSILLAVMLLGPSGAEAEVSNDKLTFWDQQRKGANGGGGEDPEEWFRAAAEVGIEFVRLSPATWKGEGRDFLLGDADRFVGIPDSDLRQLMDSLDIADRYGVKVVVTMFSLPGARWRQHNDDQFDYRLWNQEAFQKQTLAFWKELAGHLRHHPAVVGYNPLNEPHPARQAGFEDHQGEDFGRWLVTNRGGSADLDRFNSRVVEAIRRVDSETPIILEGWFHASASGLGNLEPVDDPAVLYAFHFYDPWTFTTYRINNGRFTYPGMMPSPDPPEPETWTPEQLANRLQPVLEWSRRFEIAFTRVMVAEFGCDRRVPGAREYLGDLIAQFDAHRWHWAFYSFRDPDWDGLDYELGTGKLGWEYWQGRDKGEDHESLIERHDNPLWEVLKAEFSETGPPPPD